MLATRIALPVFACAAMFGMVHGTLRAEGTTGSIYGRVYDEGSHRPACGLAVRIVSDSEPPQETRTLPDGSFSFVAVFPGTVRVMIARQTTAVEVHANLDSDETIYVNSAIADSAR